MTDQVNAQAEARKQYEENVKLGMLMDNLKIKPKDEIFPEGIDGEPTLLPMKERMPEPPCPVQELVDDMKYAWASSKKFMETKLIPTVHVSAKKSFLAARCIAKLTYKAAHSLACTTATQSHSYFQQLNHSFALQERMIRAQNQLHEGTQYFFDALQAFFAMCFTLLVQRPLHWYMQSEYRPEAILNTLRISIPSGPWLSATNEVRKTQEKIAYAYDVIRKSLLQKMLDLQAEMRPVMSPICAHEEHEVAMCFKKIANDPQKIIQCIDPLDSYKQCVDSHVDRLG